MKEQSINQQPIFHPNSLDTVGLTMLIRKHFPFLSTAEVLSMVRYAVAKKIEHIVIYNDPWKFCDGMRKMSGIPGIESEKLYGCIEYPFVNGHTPRMVIDPVAPVAIAAFFNGYNMLFLCVPKEE